MVHLGGDAGDDVDRHGSLVLRGDSGGKLLGHRSGGPPGHHGGHLLGERIDVDDGYLFLGFLGELVSVVVVEEPLHLGRVCTLALVMMTHIEWMSENPRPWQVLKTISAPNNFLLLISLILTTLTQVLGSDILIK